MTFMIKQTFSHIPNLVTISFAILVALSKSLDAPKTINYNKVDKGFHKNIHFLTPLLLSYHSHSRRNCTLPVVMFS